MRGRCGASHGRRCAVLFAAASADLWRLRTATGPRLRSGQRHGGRRPLRLRARPARRELILNRNVTILRGRLSAHFAERLERRCGCRSGGPQRGRHNAILAAKKGGNGQRHAGDGYPRRAANDGDAEKTVRIVEHESRFALRGGELWVGGPVNEGRPHHLNAARIVQNAANAVASAHSKAVAGLDCDLKHAGRFLWRRRCGQLPKCLSVRGHFDKIKRKDSQFVNKQTVECGGGARVGCKSLPRHTKVNKKNEARLW